MIYVMIVDCEVIVVEKIWVECNQLKMMYEMLICIVMNFLLWLVVIFQMFLDLGVKVEMLIWFELYV